MTSRGGPAFYWPLRSRGAPKGEPKEEADEPLSLSPAGSFLFSFSFRFRSLCSSPVVSSTFPFAPFSFLATARPRIRRDVGDLYRFFFSFPKCVSSVSSLDIGDRGTVANHRFFLMDLY